MEKLLKVFFLLWLFTLEVIIAKQMERCALVQKLKQLGLSNADNAKYVCIAFRESTFRTHVISPTNDYGIFQLSGRWWCQPSDGSQSSNVCKLSCAALLNDDISDDLKCAEIVRKEHGWNAWTTNSYCHSPQPIDDCLKGGVKNNIICKL